MQGTINIKFAKLSFQ